MLFFAPWSFVRLMIALPAAQFPLGAAPMIVRASVRPAFLFPKLLRPARDLVTRWSHRIVSAAWLSNIGRFAAARLLVEGVVDGFARWFSRIGRMPVAADGIAAMVGPEEYLHG